MIQKINSSRLETLYNNALVTKINLDRIAKISIGKIVYDKQQIFGKISEKEVIKYIHQYTGKKLDKKQVTIPRIKKIGLYKLKIQVFQDVISNLKLQILPSYRYTEVE